MKHLLKILILSYFFIEQTLAQSSPILLETQSNSVGATINLAANNLNTFQGACAPFRYGDKIYFSASVPKKTGAGMVSRLYSAWQNEPAVPQLINPKEDDLSAAQGVLNIGGDRIYYTVYRETASGKPAQGEIWYRDKRYDGSWGQVVILPKPINESGIINQQPTCGYDFLLKKEVLYFSSNRPGGKGGFDIWYCVLNRDGSFSKPINAEFNTVNDEVTPFFYSHAQILFFSSNMLAGKGGFDIYRTTKNETGTWEAAENLNAANSSFDDLYFSYHQPSKTVYLCSNRPSENCENAPIGCPGLSIFSGKLNGSIIVNTMSALDSAAVYGCNFELENRETGAIELTLLQSENSIVEFPVLPNKKYRLIVSRKGFYPNFIQLDSMFTDFAHPIHKTVLLKPMR